MTADNRQLQLTALVAVIALLIAAGLAVALHPSRRTVTAYFRSAEAVFEDNSVRVLGVPVGTITEVVPEGTRVRVRMELFDDDARLPADARAVVIAPSLVTGRYIQLTPTWSGGPELADGAVIPVERTAVPLGVDDLSRTATELSRALGPNGVNAEGALSDALDVGAANLGGNGQAFNDTVRDLGELTGTLSGSREELFGTVTELQSFVSMVAANDAEVREFNRRLADVSGFLADERDDLAAALAELSVALGEVAELRPGQPGAGRVECRPARRRDRGARPAAGRARGDPRPRRTRWATSPTPTTPRPGPSTPVPTSTS